MSAHLPGDFPDLGSLDLGPGQQGVRELIGALTAGPAPDELAGEQAVLAQFRASRSQAPEQTQPIASPAAVRKPARHWRLRLGFAAAGLLAVAGTVSAGYASALPPGVQHIAHQVLGFAGIPDAKHSGQIPPPASRSHSAAPAVRPANPAPSRPGGKGSASPGPSKHVPAPVREHLSIHAEHSQIPAGGTAILLGRVTKDSHPAAGATVRLLERPAGHSRWRSAGTARTSAGGQATVEVSGLVTNADFRFAGPSGTFSATVTVKVVPAVSLQPLSRLRHRSAFIASSPLAQPGDLVVLQVQSGSSWMDVLTRRLGGRGQRTFVVSNSAIRDRTLRVFLPATGLHAESVSSPLSVPMTVGSRSRRSYLP